MGGHGEADGTGEVGDGAEAGGAVELAGAVIGSGFLRADVALVVGVAHGFGGVDAGDVKFNAMFTGEFEIFS